MKNKIKNKVKWKTENFSPVSFKFENNFAEAKLIIKKETILEVKIYIEKTSKKNPATIAVNILNILSFLWKNNIRKNKIKTKFGVNPKILKYLKKLACSSAKIKNIIVIITYFTHIN